MNQELVTFVKWILYSYH